MLDRYHSGLELQFGHLNTKTLMHGQTLYLNQITRYISDLFDFGIFVFALLARVSLKGTIKKMNKSELWNRLSYRGLPYFFEVGSQTFRND